MSTMRPREAVSGEGSAVAHWTRKASARNWGCTRYRLGLGREPTKSMAKPALRYCFSDDWTRWNGLQRLPRDPESVTWITEHEIMGRNEQAMIYNSVLQNARG